MALRNSNVVIVGAGMGGLACALSLAKEGFTNINVYEMVSDLGFVGAGIQLAPNMARILDRLGCWKPIEADATDIKETSIRNGDSDTELAHVDLNYIRSTYTYPHMVGHRANLAGSIFDACKKESGIKFHFRHSLESVESFLPKTILRIKPRDGEAFTVTADILLACDGVKSRVRDQLLQERNEPGGAEDSGQAAYRIMLKREWVENDPELKFFFDADQVTRWIGPQRHVIAYPVSSKQIYNISTIQPDKNFAEAPSATYTTRGSKTAMMEVFRDFCPKVQRMLQLVPDDEVCEWKLRIHSPLVTWVHGAAALVGDASHPTLPHLGQGAAQAIEDAAVLAAVLKKCPSSSLKDINKSLLVFERVRKERAETLVALAAASSKTLHLGEGEAKAERDRMFAQLKSGGGKVPDKWADAEVQKMIYGHDCYQVATDEFDTIFKELSV